MTTFDLSLSCFAPLRVVAYVLLAFVCLLCGSAVLTGAFRKPRDPDEGLFP